MKTIKQVADELGVSRQVIYRKLSDLPSETLSTNDKGVQLINLEGIKFLKLRLSDKLSAGLSENCPADSLSDKIISMLQNELDTKNKLIEQQQQTINKLTDMLHDAQRTTQTEQLLHADTKKMLTLPAPAEPGVSTGGFFRKIFGQRKKGNGA